MLFHVNEDLLKSDCTAIMHQANCFSRMKSGMAKSIKEMYPEAEQVDKDSNYSPKEKLGKFTSVKSKSGVTIVNLYGQYTIMDDTTRERGFQTIYSELENAIDLFLSTTNDNFKIGVPYGMGCGLGGGDWDIVSNILENQSLKHSVDIYVYKLSS